MKQYTIILLASWAAISFAQKTALIIGITGQDGSYLAQFLLEKNYIVHGVVRRSSVPNTERISSLLDTNNNLLLHYGDITDAANITRLISEIQPNEIYNLAAQSDVRVSFDIPVYTAHVDALGVLHILEAIRAANLTKKTRFYQASTSEMFGKVQEIPQTENTPFYPRSPYGVAKLYAHWIVKNYREAYNMFACSGILFNHESPQRGHNFVTRKIARGIARIATGLQDILYLGNLDAKRDWGHTKDFVKAMWMILQQDTPQDYVIATGQTKSVREFVCQACAEVDIAIAWKGVGIDEVGYDTKTGNIIVAIDPKFFRPTEVDLLLGNAQKAYKDFGWQPTITFEQLVHDMVRSELRIAKQELKSIYKEIKANNEHKTTDLNSSTH